MKTLAIRLEDDVHAQLTMLAQLEETTVTEEIRQAIETHVERKRSEAGFTARAEAVLADIDREAKARRDAIQALFGQPAEAPEPEAEAPKPSRGRKSEKPEAPAE